MTIPVSYSKYQQQQTITAKCKQSDYIRFTAGNGCFHRSGNMLMLVTIRSVVVMHLVH